MSKASQWKRRIMQVKKAEVMGTKYNQRRRK